jgi:D-serine deaminase-like pyridoxal phosphate-dependent protein
VIILVRGNRVEQLRPINARHAVHRRSLRGRRADRGLRPSLFGRATVMSGPTEVRAIADAGVKALAFDSGPPLVCDEPAATYEHASD